MEGILLKLNKEQRKGLISTRNDMIGNITIYFSEVPASIKTNSTVSFKLCKSAQGNYYAKFVSTVNRNKALYNTESRDLWYTWGEQEEVDFIDKIVPHLDHKIIINLEKATKPWVIDLIDETSNKFADLKTQNTPFFTAGRYLYRKEYPLCDIYFWVNWKQLEYRNISIQPVRGIWRAEFRNMAREIEDKTVALHSYLHRKTDDHNARDSYLFCLSDESIFTRLL